MVTLASKKRSPSHIYCKICKFHLPVHRTSFNNSGGIRVNFPFLLCCFKLFFYVEEAEWALEVMKATGKPIALCLTMCSSGDFEGVPIDECAVRIAKAGATLH